MRKYKLKHTRPKALFGTQEAATLAAAGITAAATTAAAVMASKDAERAAQQSAINFENQTLAQTNALEERSENDAKLQEKLIQTTKTENEKFRNQMTTMQLNQQTIQGASNTMNRYNMARIQAKKGGSIKTIGSDDTLLRGRFNQNMPVKSIDGGYISYRGETPEGYSMGELIGNDHEHYHKVRGKYKSGVGLDVNGKEIEGEGNQYTPLGEIVVSTPDEVILLGKHNRKLKSKDTGLPYDINFNVAKAALAGLPIKPLAELQHFANIKDGNVETNKAKYGKRVSLKCGGRHKAAWGDWFTPYAKQVDPWNAYSNATMGKTLPNLTVTPNRYDGLVNKVNGMSIKTPTLALNNTDPIVYNGIPNREISNKSSFSDFGYELLGAGIGTLGNLVGSWFTRRGNNKAMKYGIDANNKAADALKTAYGNLKTIDENLINKKDFTPANALASVRDARVNANPELTSINRSLQRAQDATNRNTISGIARQNRLSRIETDAYDQRSQVYGNVNKMFENIAQKNQEIINQTANLNADRNAKAVQDYLSSKFNLLTYNNDIVNQRIMGAAEAEATRLGQNSQLYGSTQQANGNSIASAIANSGLSFANAFKSIGLRRANLQNALLGAGVPSKMAYYMQTNDSKSAYPLYLSYLNSNDKDAQALARVMGDYFKFNQKR